MFSVAPNTLTLCDKYLSRQMVSMIRVVPLNICSKMSREIFLFTDYVQSHTMHLGYIYIKQATCK